MEEMCKNKFSVFFRCEICLHPSVLSCQVTARAHGVSRDDVGSDISLEMESGKLKIVWQSLLTYSFFFPKPYKTFHS